MFLATPTHRSQDKFLYCHRHKTNRVRCDQLLETSEFGPVLLGLVAHCIEVEVDQTDLVDRLLELESQNVAEELSRPKASETRVTSGEFLRKCPTGRNVIPCVR